MLNWHARSVFKYMRVLSKLEDNDKSNAVESPNVKRGTGTATLKNVALCMTTHTGTWEFNDEAWGWDWPSLFKFEKIFLWLPKPRAETYIVSSKAVCYLWGHKF